MRQIVGLLKMFLKAIRHSIVRHKRLYVNTTFLSETENGNGDRIAWFTCSRCKTTMAIGYRRATKWYSNTSIKIEHG